MNKCIILIGYRGVGKSTISDSIAAKSDLKKLSLDTVLAERIGNLQAFIKQYGWEFFRKEETRMISELNCELTVIDCGGGVVENKINMEYLGKLGPVFYLNCSPDEIYKRLSTTNPRLSLTGDKQAQDEIRDVLARRDPLYRKYADFVIDTDSLTPEESACKIVELYQSFVVENEVQLK